MSFTHLTFRNWGGEQVKSCYNIHAFNLKPTCHLCTFLVVTYMMCNYLILSLNDMCPFPYQGCHFLFLRAKYQLDGICFISIFACLCKTDKMRFYSIQYATFIIFHIKDITRRAPVYIISWISKGDNFFVFRFFVSL